MGSVERRAAAGGRTVWVARWRDASNQQRSKSGFKTKKAAEAHLITVEGTLISGTYVDPRGGRITVAEYGAGWLKSRGAHLRPSTARSEHSTWRHHVLPRWGDQQLAKIKHSEVQSWIADLVAREYSATTVKRAHGILMSILETAVRDRRLNSNSAKGVKLPQKTRLRRAYLTPAQVEQLADDSKHPAVIRLLAYTGLRWGEATGLRVRNVNFARRRITVEENAVRVGGKVEVGLPKTAHGLREVAFPRFLIPDLEALAKGKSGGQILLGDGHTHMVLPNSQYGWFASAVKRAMQTDPSFPRVTPHDLRHTAASLAVSAGANVKVVQRMLGHASAAMTLDVYADLFEDDMDDVAAALDDLHRS